MKFFFTNPWSFLWGGLLVGLGEALYFLKYKTPIPITTGLAQMFGALEENFTHTNFIKRIYKPDIHWVLLGVIAGGVIVTLIERERRNWVKYPNHVLLFTFAGAMTFGFGTRLAQGCTVWHYLGGISVMSLTSIVVAAVSVPFAYLGFLVMSKLDAANYFKHNETKATVQKCVELEYQTETLCYSPGYNSHRDPVRVVLNVFFVLFVISVGWTALKGTSPNSIGTLPWFEILLKGFTGFLIGFGIAKSGFGTECAVMAVESLYITKERFNAMKVAKITQTMFTGLMPFGGILVAILVFNITVLFTWIVLGWNVPVVVEGGKYNWGLHLGHLVGGAMLGIGSVMMLGCEVRTYARLGMGYRTALASLPGFMLGYLPYTFYKDQIDGIFFSRGIMKAKNLLELLPDVPYIRYGFGFVYTAMLIALLGWTVWKGSKMAKVSKKEYLTLSTDEIFLKDLPEIKARNVHGGKDTLKPVEPADLGVVTFRN